MASNPPGQCCTLGHLHEGEPKGKVVTASDGKTDVYLATPPTDKADKKDCGILYMPDVFGIWQNSKLMADQFAAAGYTTLVLDLFNGDQCPVNRPADFDTFAWIAKGSDGNNPHTAEYVDPVIVTGIETLRQQGIKKIGAVGYCFGAKYVVRHYKDGIDVGFAAHPSFVEEAELSAITGPFSIAAAETDPIFPAEKRRRSEEILKDIKVPYQIYLFYGVEHGFAVRGDPKVKASRFAKEQAFLQAVAWFDEFLHNA